MDIEELEKEVAKMKRKCCCSVSFYDVLPGKGQKSVLYIDKATGDEYIWDGSGYISVGGGSVGITDVTYVELVTLIGASGLTAGSQYRITDFETKHYLIDTENDGNDTSVIFTGVTEALIVIATSDTTIDKVATSSLYPNDIIYYDWNPENWKWDYAFADINTDDSNPVIIPGFKGVIHFRHDTINDNSLGFDFRNVKNRRYKYNVSQWEVGTPYSIREYVEYSGAIYICISANDGNAPVDGESFWAKIIDLSITEYINSKKGSFNGIPTIDGDFIDVLTFVPYSGSTYDFSFKNVHIAPTKDNYNLYHNYATILANTVVFTGNDSGMYAVAIGEYSFGNTFIGASGYFTTESYFYHNTIADAFIKNTIGPNFDSNIIGSGFNGNVIGNSFDSNIIGSGFVNNTIRNNFSTNTIGSNFGNNTIGADFSSNVVGSGFNSTDVKAPAFTGINFMSATFVYTTYGKEIFNNSAGTARLSYYSALDVQTIVNPTD